MGDAEFRAYFLGRGYQGEKIVAVLDDEPAADVVERIATYPSPVVLAVKSPSERWGFPLRRVDCLPVDGEHVGEAVAFAEGASIGMVVAATGAHTFEVPHGDAEPMRVLVA